MSDFEKRIIVYLSTICLVAGICFIIFKQIEISNRQKEIETSVIKQKEIGDSIVRSMSQYATPKDVEKIIKDNKIDLSKINKDLADLNAKVDSINTVIFSSNGYKGDNLPSDGSIDNPPENDGNPPVVLVPCGDSRVECLQDKHHYFSTTQLFKINELFSNNTQVPFGEVGFTAAKDKPWSIDAYPREYKVSTVSAVDEDHRVINYNKVEIKVKDKSYDLPIAKAETTQVFPEAKFRGFDPRLYVGVEAGVDSKLQPQLGPSLSMAFMNYGKYRDTPDFSILQVGAMATIPDKKVQLSITPVSYNIGKHISFIRNTYLGGSVNVSADKDVSVTAGIKVGL